jgi:hypothetical protein
MTQRGQICMHDLPDNLKVNPEVFMNNSMAQPDDFVPFEARMSFLKVNRQPICGLAYNLKISDYRVNGLLVV